MRNRETYAYLQFEARNKARKGTRLTILKASQSSSLSYEKPIQAYPELATALGVVM